MGMQATALANPRPLPQAPLTGRGPQRPAPPQAPGDRLSLGPRAIAKAAEPQPEGAPRPSHISRPFYTGGAPALRQELMDSVTVQNNLLLRGLYALPERLSPLRQVYMQATKVVAPLGAVVNFGFNLVSARRIFRDPQAPAGMKAAVLGSTALAGVSAGAATTVGAAAFGLVPLSQAAFRVLGRVAEVGGMGAGAILAGIDTYHSFQDPKASAAEKGFSSLATLGCTGLALVTALGVGGPWGIALGLGAMAATLAKRFVGQQAWANRAFEALGVPGPRVAGA